MPNFSFNIHPVIADKAEASSTKRCQPRHGRALRVARHFALIHRKITLIPQKTFESKRYIGSPLTLLFNQVG